MDIDLEDSEKSFSQASTVLLSSGKSGFISVTYAAIVFNDDRSGNVYKPSVNTVFMNTLMRYPRVSAGIEQARFLIAKKIPVDYDLDAPLSDLWSIHDDAMREFNRVEKIKKPEERKDRVLQDRCGFEILIRVPPLRGGAGTGTITHDFSVGLRLFVRVLSELGDLD